MSSERYEILQDDLDSLLERLEASLTWISKKSSNPNEQRSGLARCQRELEEGESKYFRLFCFISAIFFIVFRSELPC